MKKLLLVLSCLVLSPTLTFANEVNADEIEVSQDIAFDESQITIKEVRELAKTIPEGGSCLDEYLTRRKQIVAKLVFVPVTATAAVMGSVYGGALVAVGVANATNVSGWGALGYVIVGGAAGAVTSGAYMIYDTSVTTLSLVDNNLMLKALAEQHLNRVGVHSKKLYSKYAKATPVNPMNQELFLRTLLDKDISGELCDGSMVKQPKLKIGFKLKYKVAKAKDVIKKISL